MTITSIAPLKVAGLIEFQVLDTEPLILRTYCILETDERLAPLTHWNQDQQSI